MISKFMPDRDVIIIISPKDGTGKQRVKAPKGVETEFESTDLINVHVVPDPASTAE